MKSIFFLLLSIVFLSARFQDESAKLTVSIEGIESISGNLQVAIFRKKDDFPKHNKQFKGQIIPVTASAMSCTFTGIPADTYAIAVYHDKNGNGKLDKNLVGMPTERYGFSNQARETFSAPSFESAAFSLKNERKMLVILK